MERAERYVGIYSMDSPWSAPFRIVERSGKLWLGGTDELQWLTGDHFCIAGEEGTIELEFASFLQGQSQAIRSQGEVFHRVHVIPTS